MNAYTNYILTVGTLEANILASEGTEKHLDVLMYAIDEKTTATLHQLLIDAVKHVLACSEDRKADLSNIESIHKELVELIESSVEKVSKTLH